VTQKIPDFFFAESQVLANLDVGQGRLAPFARMQIHPTLRNLQERSHFLNRQEFIRGTTSSEQFIFNLHFLSHK
jgi:hypothetical protein